MRFFDTLSPQHWVLVLIVVILVGVFCLRRIRLADPTIDCPPSQDQEPCDMDLWTFQIPIPVALAIVATIGYIFGRRSKNPSDDSAFRSRRELRRAQLVAAELEKIAWDLRKNLAKHHSSVNKFRDRVGKLNDDHQEASWKELCREAEDILKPTLHLATQIANAYDEIRQQSANLMTFTEVRTDPLTGINNRRGMADAVANQFAMMHRYGTTFSLAILNVDHFKNVNDEKGHLHGDQTLQELARLFDEFARETDVVARYGGEEFVVVMPQTDLQGAAVFAERLRKKVESQIGDHRQRRRCPGGRRGYAGYAAGAGRRRPVPGEIGRPQPGFLPRRAAGRGRRSGHVGPGNGSVRNFSSGVTADTAVARVSAICNGATNSPG